MKYHGGKTELAEDEFKAELLRMDKADADARAELELLRKVRSYIRKVDPELVGEKRSLHEELARSPEEIRRRDEERKNGNAKKHEQARQ